MVESSSNRAAGGSANLVRYVDLASIGDPKLPDGAVVVEAVAEEAQFSVSVCLGTGYSARSIALAPLDSLRRFFGDLSRASFGAVDARVLTRCTGEGATQAVFADVHVEIHGKGIVKANDLPPWEE